MHFYIFQNSIIITYSYYIWKIIKKYSDFLQGAEAEFNPPPSPKNEFSCHVEFFWGRVGFKLRFRTLFTQYTPPPCPCMVMVDMSASLGVTRTAEATWVRCWLLKSISRNNVTHLRFYKRNILKFASNFLTIDVKWDMLATFSARHYQN